MCPLLHELTSLVFGFYSCKTSLLKQPCRSYYVVKKQDGKLKFHWVASSTQRTSLKCILLILGSSKFPPTINLPVELWKTRSLTQPWYQKYPWFPASQVQVIAFGQNAECRTFKWAPHHETRRLFKRHFRSSSLAKLRFNENIILE